MSGFEKRRNALEIKRLITLYIIGVRNKSNIILNMYIVSIDGFICENTRAPIHIISITCFICEYTRAQFDTISIQFSFVRTQGLPNNINNIN